MNVLNNTSLKQIILLLLIALIGCTLVWQLYYFIPGLLGGITCYILARSFFFKLTQKYGWKRWLAAILIILLLVVIFLLPVWLVIQLLLPKLTLALSHANEVLVRVEAILKSYKDYLPQEQISMEQIQTIIQKIALVVPTFLNATLGLITNIMTALFLLYFMLMGGKNMERKISLFLPVNDKNKDALWKETQNMVVSNAIGIPLLIVCQALIAVLGYLIFGLEQPLILGLLTGMASVIPIVGTMIVWIPVCLVLFFSGEAGMGIGLALYCGIVVSNVDNVLRFTIMKKIGNVHPLVTVFGVIVGLKLFGIMGLIFGPLLISYFFILIKIYRLEFSSSF